MSEQYEDQNTDSSGQDQTEGGTGGEGGGEENNEADMIFAPEASKPGRNAGMLMIAFVMIGVGVIYFMRARAGGPRAVSADVAKADTLIKGFDGSQVRIMQDLLKNTQKVVDQFNDEGKKTREDPKVEINPFAFKSPTEPKNTGDTGGDTRKHDAAKAEFLDGLKTIKVQYLMVSQFAKTAMINGKLVQEGQEVDGYLIERVTPQEVVVSKTIRGYTFKAAKQTSNELK